MSSALPRFREVKGIGPGTEGRLHEAGVYTWEALLDVLVPLAGLRGQTGATIRELADRVAERASKAGGSSPPQRPDGERSEAFIVRMSMTDDGRLTRTAMTHVRSQTEQAWAGWPPGQIIRFLEEHAGVRAAAPSPRQTTVEMPAPPHDHAISIDAGKAIGGGRRDVELIVSTAAMAGAGEFEYLAMLEGRGYGRPGDDSSWRGLAKAAGHGRAPEDLPLQFPALDLPGGIQRLRLRLQLRTSDEAQPALELR